MPMNVKLFCDEEDGKMKYRKTPKGVTSPQSRRAFLRKLCENHRILRDAGYPVPFAKFVDDDEGGTHVEDAVEGGLEVRSNARALRAFMPLIQRRRREMLLDIREKLGLSVMDRCDANTLFDPKKEVVWLIDLEDVRPFVHDTRSFHERVADKIKAIKHGAWRRGNPSFYSSFSSLSKPVALPVASSDTTVPSSAPGSGGASEIAIMKSPNDRPSADGGGGGGARAASVNNLDSSVPLISGEKKIPAVEKCRKGRFPIRGENRVYTSRVLTAKKTD